MKKMAPVVVFVYNRLEHTRQIFESLERNSLVRESELFIFSDACPRGKPLQKVLEVRKFIREYAEYSAFKKVTIICAEKNKGLARSVIEGTTAVLENYKNVIVLEDDLVVSDDFLEYMNEGLEYYQFDKKVWSISGYTDQFTALEKYEDDVYAAFRGCSWGWATWRNRWCMVNWKVEDYKIFKYNPLARIKFNRGGNDLSRMLDKQMQGLLDSWAIRWCYASNKLNTLTIYPRETKILNKGMDGSGVHCEKTKENNRKLKGSGRHTKFIPIVLNYRILKQFKKCHERKK